MSNQISAYDMIFYAQKSLEELHKALGLANAVFRGYDKASQNQGSTIQISVPSSFTAQNAPSSSQDLDTQKIQISLDSWKEVKFGLTDKDLSLSKEQLISDHFSPAAYALADIIDTDLSLAMYQGTPWEVSASNPASVANVIDCRKRLSKNLVNMKDDNRFLMASPDIAAELLSLPAFAQASGSGDAGTATQITGFLGRRYGLNSFENQNAQTHTAGAIVSASPNLDGSGSAVEKGTSSIVVNDDTMTGTVKAGDSLVIAGNEQRYVITANATASGNSISLSISPPLVQDYDDDSLVTFYQNSGVQSLAFHRGCAALAMAPLSRMGAEIGGAMIETITDPVTSLALRLRMYYDGDNSMVKCALDCLYGIKMLRPNAAVRLVDAS